VFSVFRLTAPSPLLAVGLVVTLSSPTIAPLENQRAGEIAPQFPSRSGPRHGDAGRHPRVPGVAPVPLRAL